MSAIVIPLRALTRRDDQDGVFILSEDAQRVMWRTVRPGIRQNERLQVVGEELQGRW